MDGRRGLLAWHNFIASVFAVRIDGVLVDDRVHHRIIGVPVQFAVIFGGEEYPVEYHLTYWFAVGPRIPDALVSRYLRKIGRLREETYTWVVGTKADFTTLFAVPATSRSNL